MTFWLKDTANAFYLCLFGLVGGTDDKAEEIAEYRPLNLSAEWELPVRSGDHFARVGWPITADDWGDLARFRSIWSDGD